MIADVGIVLYSSAPKELIALHGPKDGKHSINGERSPKHQSTLIANPITGPPNSKTEDASW